MPRPNRCGACDKSAARKPTSVYTRWYPQNGPTLGYALKLCEACVETFFVPWIKAAYSLNADDESCPACGMAVLDRWSYTWVTAFAAKTEPLRFTLITCDTCAIAFRSSFLDGGAKLDDRPEPRVEAGGGFWQQLGVTPLIPS